MFSSPVISIVINLLFIYLLYSLLASIVQEIISVHLGIRARILRKGVSRMLDDDKGGQHLTNSFYQHPLVKYLGENKLHSKPSYMSAQNFSKVLIDLLRGRDVRPDENFAPLIQQAMDTKKLRWNDVTINEETLVFLRSVWADAQGDVEKFKFKLEEWFEDTMSRASGWYKKRIQMILFIIGFSLAVIFNVDSIAIAKKLSANPALSKQLADNAEAYIKTHQTLSHQGAYKPGDQAAGNVAMLYSEDSLLLAKSRYLINAANKRINDEIQNANHVLGLGWKGSCQNSFMKNVCIEENFHRSTVLGWIITALAISLGAPFWFDMLGKLMKLRGTGGNTSATKKGTTKHA